MSTLIFDAKAVARLMTHATNSPVRIATWGERLEEGARIRGVKVDDVPIEQWDDLTAEAEDFIPPPALHFVHDQGLYLMSNGRPSQPKDDPNRVIYAEGFNPEKEAFEDWWEGARAIVGGDDFVEPLPIDQHIEPARKMLNGSIEPTHFFIKVEGYMFSYGFEWL